MSEKLPYISERNEALTKLDMDWARKRMPTAPNDLVRLISMHKARYDCTGIQDELRQESRKWLESRGYKRAYGMEFSSDESLPI